MENFIIWIWGFVFGFGIGVFKGRRSIVQEAQMLVANAIMEVKNYERSRKPS